MKIFTKHIHCRTEFRLYLSRPDTKQEFLSQWQASYNELTPQLRREALMKAELHQRVDVRTENNTICSLIVIRMCNCNRTCVRSYGIYLIVVGRVPRERGGVS